jgi:hypothetical protein
MSTGIPLSPTADGSTTTARNAIVIAGGVGALVLVLTLIGTLLTSFSSLFYGVFTNFNDGLSTTYYMFSGFVSTIFTWILPIAIGVFLSLKFFRPIAATTAIGVVLVRGLIATAAGAIVALVISLLWALVSSISLRGPLFGDSFPGITDSGSFPYSIVGTFFGLIQRAVEVTPVVLLVVVLGWLWLRRTPAV